MKKKVEAEFAYHGDYFKIAVETYEQIKRLRKEHDRIQEELKHEKEVSDERVFQLATKNDAIEQQARVVIIFSALSVEAYINDYAISQLSKNYLTNYLDKLDLLSKWIVIPRIITGKQLDPGAKSVQDLSWLITQRNNLVHYKSRKKAIDEIEASDFYWDYDAEKAMKTVKNLVLRLKEIDKTVDIHWLK